MVLRQMFAHFERLAASMSRTELRVQTPISLFLRFTLMKRTRSPLFLATEVNHVTYILIVCPFALFYSRA
jgi:hypothetical protein